jgi:hypothetical protein
MTQLFLLQDSFYFFGVDVVEDTLFGDLGAARALLSFKTYFMSFFSVIITQIVGLYGASNGF